MATSDWPQTQTTFSAKTLHLRVFYTETKMTATAQSRKSFEHECLCEIVVIFLTIKCLPHQFRVCSEQAEKVRVQRWHLSSSTESQKLWQILPHSLCSGRNAWSYFKRWNHISFAPDIVYFLDSPVCLACLKAQLSLYERPANRQTLVCLRARVGRKLSRWRWCGEESEDSRTSQFIKLVTHPAPSEQNLEPQDLFKQFCCLWSLVDNWACCVLRQKIKNKNTQRSNYDEHLKRVHGLSSF